MPSLFTGELRVVPESSGGTCGSAVRIVGKWKSKELESQKEYILVGEGPTSVMPDEMEKLIRELPRDTEIIALFKRISDECMIARPDPAILFRQAAWFP